MDVRKTEEGTFEGARQPSPAAPLFSVSADAVADSAFRAQQAAAGTTELQCDVCDEPISGEPSGRGLYMWSRGEELRFEEPSLCGRCATAIGVTALSLWSAEEDGG